MQASRIAVYLQIAGIIGLSVAALAAVPYLYSYTLLSFLPYFLTGWHLLIFALFWLSRYRRGFLWVSFSLLPSLLFLDGREWHFQYKKRFVLQADLELLRSLGQHFIVRYSKSAAVQELLAKQALAGVYLSRALVQDLELHELLETTRALRERRLLICADQEGGPVNHLSPPLVHFAHLRSALEPLQEDGGMERFRLLARDQASKLAEASISWNLAPVVDLYHAENTYLDFYSSINERSLGSDPELVRQAMKAYCEELQKQGIGCVRKHFPGLGGVKGDTHLFDLELETSTEELALRDWLPFAGDFPIMLSHVRLAGMDGYPVSSSPATIRFLRETRQFDGILITDDMSMGPVVSTGLSPAVRRALNAGVDFILISHHDRRLFEILYDLIRVGGLDQDALDRSRLRVRKWRELLQENESP